MKLDFDWPVSELKLQHGNFRTTCYFWGIRMKCKHAWSVLYIFRGYDKTCFCQPKVVCTSHSSYVVMSRCMALRLTALCPVAPLCQVVTATTGRLTSTLVLCVLFIIIQNVCCSSATVLLADRELNGLSYVLNPTKTVHWLAEHWEKRLFEMEGKCNAFAGECRLPQCSPFRENVGQTSIFVFKEKFMC
jgi:hypothetical protein